MVIIISKLSVRSFFSFFKYNELKCALIYLEKNSYTVVINGVNSKQEANWKLRNGQMIIGENKFRIPFTYSFEMSLGQGIQMVLGCNFIRSMQGGIRIEGNEVTFYKNMTTITTNQSVVHAIRC